MVDFAEAGFILDLFILISSGPIAYLSWSSGLIASMLDQARDNGWTWPPRKGSKNYKPPAKLEDHVSGL